MANMIRRVLFGTRPDVLVKTCKPTVINPSHILKYQRKPFSWRETKILKYNSSFPTITQSKNHHNTSSQNINDNFPWIIVAGLGFVAGSGDDPPYENVMKVKKFIKFCQRGQSAEVQMYLKNGADPNARHPLGWSGLHAAAVNGNGQVAKLLIDAGADVDLPDEFTNSHDKAREKYMQSLEVERIREHDFSDELNRRATFRDCTPLHYALLIGDIGMVSLLLEAGADPLMANAYGKTPLDYSKGLDKKFRILLQKYAVIHEEKRQKLEAEERRRFPLEKRMKEYIVGQEGAITTVASAIRRKENGWIDDEHPLVFLFLGSSGIGKTELAKQVASYLHKDKKKAFVRLDMSEFQEKHEVAKLIGSPPGKKSFAQLISLSEFYNKNYVS